ncbi:hypothetical protein MRX96_044422 [Rhipicephalus microplus]
MSPSSVAARSAQRLESSEHIGGNGDRSGSVTNFKGHDDRAVGLSGGPGSTATAEAAMISAEAAEEVARLVCHKSTIVAAFAWRALEIRNFSYLLLGPNNVAEKLAER